MTMRHEERPAAVTLFALSACLVLVVAHARQLVSIVLSSGRLAQWDMAKYAVSGQRLAASLKELDLWYFLAELHGLSVWPPVYPLLEVPAIWIWGLEVSVLRLLQTALWSAMVFATWWALRRIRAGVFGEVAGLAAATAVASVPIIAGLATVNMLEVPGLLLLASSLGAYLRALGAATRRAAERWWRATWLLTLALFLCKYNYGLLWLLPVGLAEARRWAGSWSGVLGRTLPWLSARLTFRSLLSPFSLFVLSMLASIAAIRLTGGFEGEILGVELSISSPGGPAQVLYLACWLRWLLPWRRARLRWRRLSRRPAAQRLFARCFALPAALWMLPPPHLKDFFSFLENRHDGPALGTWSWLTYYPRELSAAYGSPLLGATLLALAVWGLSRRPPCEHGGARRRILALGLVVWAAAILLHPYKLPRFAVFLWWWLALAAAWGLAELLRLAVGRRPNLALAVGLLMPLASAGCGIELERVRGEHLRRTVPAETGEALEAALQANARGRSGSPEIPRTAVAGTWNQLSPHLVEWSARQRRLPDGWVLSDFDIAGRDAGRLTSWLDKQPVERLVVLEKDGDSAFTREVSWLAPVRVWLRAGGRYRLERSVEAGGYRLLFFSPLSRVEPEASPSRPLASSSAKAAS